MDVIILIIEMRCTLKLVVTTKRFSISFQILWYHLDVIILIIEMHCTLKLVVTTKRFSISFQILWYHLDVIILIIEMRCTLKLVVTTKRFSISFQILWYHLDVIILIIEMRSISFQMWSIFHIQPRSGPSRWSPPTATRPPSERLSQPTTGSVAPAANSARTAHATTVGSATSVMTWRSTGVLDAWSSPA